VEDLEGYVVKLPKFELAHTKQRGAKKFKRKSRNWKPFHQRICSAVRIICSNSSLG
jgi:hypothetical protein